MATHSREARRRKIMEKGADRLALITGQIRNIDPSSSVVEIDSNEEVAQQPSPLATSASSAPADDDNYSLGFSIRDAVNVDDGGTMGTMTREPETCIGNSEFPTPSETDNREPQSSLLANQPPAMRPSSSEPSGIRRKLIYGEITGKKITTAISETEKSRLLCTVVIAIMSVLSTCGFPLLGFIVYFRPLFLLMLTNFTLVVARIFFDIQRGTGRPYRNNSKSSDGGDWIQLAGKALEASFVVKKAVDAVLLDFSVYAVIVICVKSFF